MPNAPTKAVFFAWEAVWGMVLTLDKIQRRGWHLPNKCFLCGCAKETIHHLLLHCPIVSSLWEIIFSLFGLGFSLNQSRKQFSVGKALLWGKKGLRFGSRFPCAFFGQFGTKEIVWPSGMGP